MQVKNCENRFFYGVDENFAGQLNFLAKAPRCCCFLLSGLLNFDPILQKQNSLWYQIRGGVKTETSEEHDTKRAPDKRNTKGPKITESSEDFYTKRAPKIWDQSVVWAPFLRDRFWKFQKKSSSGSAPALVLVSCWLAFAFWLFSALLAAAAIGIWTPP